MKRGEVLLIAFALIFISLISVVSAECEENDRIMKLSSPTNSHGALWNDANYNWDICYSKIFNKNYEGDLTTAHNCVGSNKVLGLFATTNSHAEVPSLYDYKVNVCYGDLSCRKADETKGENCAADEKVVVRLYQETNSHISNAGDTTYKIKICCKTVSVEGAYWANMNDVEITEANLNDLVKLVVSGEGFVDKQIEYNIYKGVSWWFDSKVASSSSTGFTTWRAGKKADGSLAEGIYYFKARAVGAVGGEWVQSGNLEVKTEENNPPSVNIIKPEDKQIYFKGENLNFKAEISDVDDDFTYEWDIGNGTTKVSDSLDFTYAYTSTGQKNIVLKATDDRGATSIARLSILVVDYATSGKYAFAYIDLPEFLKGYLSPVDFNGGSSYAVEVTAGFPPTISCISGTCPTPTKGCYPVNTPAPGCSQIAVTGAPAANHNLLFFLWEFSKDNWQTKLASHPISGNGGPGLVDFNRRFTQTGKHYTKLNVSLASSEIFEPGIFDSEFFVGTSNAAGECSEDKKKWIDENAQEYSTLLPGVCGLYDENCCRDGYSCQSGTCLTIPDFCTDENGDPLILTCKDYTDSTNCNADSCNIKESEWEVADCDNVGVSCRGCEWDSNDGTGKCKFVRRVDTGDPTGPDNSYECLRTTTRTVTADGESYLISWTENKVRFYDGDEESVVNSKATHDGVTVSVDCRDGETTIRKSVKLMFFTLASLIIAVVIIIIIYFIKIKKQSKKETSTRKN